MLKRSSKTKKKVNYNAVLNKDDDEIIDMDLDSKCRACLHKGKIPIINKKTPNILESIREIANISVEENDKFPKLLCRQCYNLLQSAIKFKTKAQETDHLLRNSICTTESNDIKQESEGSCNEDNNDDSLVLENPVTVKIEVSEIPSSHSNNKNMPELIEDDCHSNKNMPELIEDDCHNNKHKQLNKLNNEKTKKPCLKVTCHLCEKSVTKYYFKDHLALHGVGTKKDKVKTECKLCKKVIEKAYYKKHVESVHSNDKKVFKYVCYVCGKTFKYQSGYSSHILSHGNEFPHKCHLCPYKGRHSGLLKTHMKTHTRDYKYQCTDCPARFLTSGNLNKHMLKHKERKFKCESCSRAFHSKLEMEKHFMVDHMGVKNHICNICDKAFGYRSAMMKHQLHVHKRQKMVNGRMPSYLEAEIKGLNVEKKDSST